MARQVPPGLTLCAPVSSAALGGTESIVIFVSCMAVFLRGEQSVAFTRKVASPSFSLMVFALPWLKALLPGALHGDLLFGNDKALLSWMKATL
jgi:hypothetical protein